MQVFLLKISFSFKCFLHIIALANQLPGYSIRRFLNVLATIPVKYI